MNTRKPEEGPDGITLWNHIFKKIKDQDSAITLCKSLIQMKLDSLDAIDEICDRWQLCIKMKGGETSEALIEFEQQMDLIRECKLKKQREEKVAKSRSVPSVKDGKINTRKLKQAESDGKK